MGASTKCSPEEAWGVKDQEIVDTMECSTLRQHCVTLCSVGVYYTTSSDW